jgi:tetratricopeptide (TPR) repeat protein
MDLLKRNFIVREPLLVGILLVIATIFSALTHSYSQAYDRKRSALGIQWFERGQEELGQNHSLSAVEDFRTALVYDPGNWDFRMHLAGALTQAGQTEQALNYYQNLWQTRPNSGPINLQLGRLTAREGDAGAAERYFNGAIFGDWPENPEQSRRAASLELIHFYLDRGDSGHAISQLMILADNLPENPQLQAQVADLFSKAGDDRRALKLYRSAERLDPDSVPAILGAGEAAYRIGDFHTAQSYLTRTLRLDESDASAKRLLAVLQSFNLLDPNEHGLSEGEKINRTLRMFEISGNRLQFCAGLTTDSSIASQAEQWKQRKSTANARFLTQHPEEVDSLQEFSISTETLAQLKCGEPSVDDSAILAIARHREMEER